MFGWSRELLRDNKGAVAPLVGIALVGLVAMGALAWDVSRGFALRGELDSAVDAAALAGATQLDFGSDAIDRAKAAAQGALVTNAQRLANSAEANVAIADADITFLSAISPDHVETTDPTAANFIEIDLTPRDMGLVLGTLVRVTKFNVTAHAVAGFGSAICLVPPLLVCNPDEPAGSTDTSLPFDPDTHIGQSLLLTPSPSNKPDAWSPGQFGFLDVGTVPDLKDAMARNSPQTQCFGSQVTTEPGNVASVDQWFNTRFDIYASGASGLKSNPLYSPASDTITGISSAPSDCSPKIDPPSNDCSTTAAADPYGLPIDCGMVASDRLGSGTWNYRRYFNSNHSGVDPAAIDWTPYGPSGSVAGQPTRYQVYNWESAILSGAITKPSGAFSRSQDSKTPSGANDWARPACNTQTPSELSTDRRVISAVVANCQAQDIRGHDTVDVITNVTIFLTNPVTTPDQTIYGEIVGKTTGGSGSTPGQPVKRFWVRLYE